MSSPGMGESPFCVGLHINGQGDVWFALDTGPPPRKYKLINPSHHLLQHNAAARWERSNDLRRQDRYVGPQLY